MQANEYVKTGEDGGLAGTKYQVKLLEYFLLQGFCCNHNNFKLGTERKSKGKFDDVEYWIDDKIVVQVQAKHKKLKQLEKSIKFADLFPENIFDKKYSFSIYRYLVDFHDSKHLILCTNSNIDLDEINACLKKKTGATPVQNTFLVEQKLPEACLFPSFGNIKCFCFKENLESVKSYIRTKYNITNEKLESFLGKFILLYMPDKDLDNQLEELIKHINIRDTSIPVETVQNFLYKEVEQWFQSREPKGESEYKGILLTSKNVTDYICQFKNQQYMHTKIMKHEIKFIIKDPQNNNSYPVNINDNTVLLKIKNRLTYTLHESKILHYLENNLMFQNNIKIIKNNDLYKKILFVYADIEDIAASQEIISFFEMPHYFYLVVPVSKLQIQDSVEKLLVKLKNNENKTKKIIFITDNDSDLQNMFEKNFEANVKFSELSEDIQEKILQRDIKYQGLIIPLRNLTELKKPNYDEIIDEYTLMTLITDTKIITVNDIGPCREIPSGYINRKLVPRKNTDPCVDDEEKLDAYENFFPKFFEDRPNIYEEELEEENFCTKVLEDPKNIITIFGSPGMGKSTFLNKLEGQFRENLCWIMKANLKSESSIDILEKNEYSLKSKDFLNLFNISKLTTFEENIFKICDKIILLDAFDEISVEHANIILNTLCQEYCRFIKKIITSRHHTYDKFEEKRIEFTIYSLKSFSKIEIVNYLSTFWYQEMKTNSEYANKLINEQIIEFTTILVEKLNDKPNWTKVNSVIGIPLLTDLISQIYKEQCDIFLVKGFHEFKLPEAISKNWLYKQFIECKKQIFIKKSSQQDWYVRKLLEKEFEAACAAHFKRAMEAEGMSFLTSSEINQNEYDEETLLKIGILEIYNNEIGFKHKTFSEYFAAKYLCKLLLETDRAEYFKYISEDIHMLICEMMLEDHLESDNLDTFLTQYFKFMNNYSQYSKTQIFLRFLSKVGYGKLWEWQHYRSLMKLHVDVVTQTNLQEELLMILNKVDNFNFLLDNYPHRIINKNDKLLVDCTCLSRLPRTDYVFNQLDNDFDDDDNICISTPLHYIIEYLRPEKFCYLLLKKDHSIRVVDHFGRTPLHLAATTGNVKIVEELLSRDNTVDATDRYGKTPLHYAVEGYKSIETKDILDTLLELLLDKPPVDQGHFEKIVDLLLNKGHSVNLIDVNGRMPLHNAALHCKPELVEVLLNHEHTRDVPDNDGETPLHCATQSTYSKEIINLLLNKGHSVNVVDKRGNKPLHYVACYCEPDTLELLLNHDKSIDVRNNYGETPLHFASQFGCSKEEINLLINKGHSVNVIDKSGKMPLHYAIQRDKLDFVELLLNQNQTPDIPDNNGQTPLHFASQSKYSKEKINLLLNKGHSVNVIDKRGKRPLHYAAQYCKPETLEFLLNHDKSIDVPDNDGETPLHYASQSRNYCKEKINLLLNKGASVNVIDKSGKMPLHYAAQYCIPETLELLLNLDKSIDVPDNHGRTPLHYAITQVGYYSTVNINLLLNEGHSVNVTDKRGKRPLHYAAQYCKPETFELLLNHDKSIDEPDKHGRTSLHYAAQSIYSKEKINLLLNKGHSVNIIDKSGKKPLHYAAQYCKPETLELLLNHDKSIDVPDKQGRTPLHYAVTQVGYYSTININLLLNEGHSVNVTDKRGRRPLHYAAQNCDPKNLELLLNHDKTIDVPDKYGRTPLHYATQGVYFSNIYLLIKKGHSVNVIDKRGKRPLHYAAQYCKPEALKRLLNHDKSIDVPDKYGRTPLHYATQCRIYSKENINILLNKGHSVNVIDKRGKRPLHYAAQYCKPETLERFLNHDKSIDVPDKHGRTPLHYATQGGHYSKENINLLLNKGHSVTFIDQFGKKSLYYPENESESELVSEFELELESELDSESSELDSE